MGQSQANRRSTMWSRVAVVLLSAASCHAGLLGAGTGEGSCAAAPFRALAVKWPLGCPAPAPCCSEYGYCQPEASWHAGAFRDCNGVSNGRPLAGRPCWWLCCWSCPSCCCPCSRPCGRCPCCSCRCCSPCRSCRRCCWQCLHCCCPSCHLRPWRHLQHPVRRLCWSCLPWLRCQRSLCRCPCRCLCCCPCCLCRPRRACCHLCRPLLS